MQIYLALAAKLPVLVLVLLAAMSVTAGDYFAKMWSINQRPLFLAAALLGYFGSGFFYTPTLLREGLVVTSILWSVVSIAGFLVIGLVVFKESLSTIEMVGVGFGIVSLIVLSFASH